MPTDAQPTRRRIRFQLFLALLALAIILALIFTPPLVNVDRYRHRIAQTMSDSLGRPVHIDDVKLHLLPMPSLELRNVVVSEDPAFGSEPTIRANRVLAIIRPSSLWRRPVEFSTIRFTTDENGSGPSVNLVRNAAGRWNLDSVLMQAAHVPTAPTAQKEAGPAPRFPYIEATAARVNLKLGLEKMPFSLTEADFALWLPEPDQWHVRLRGRPIRTDANLNETGLVSVEGTLHRASAMAQVPVDLQGSWTGAQLGEATTLVTGEDMGWRGTVTLNTALRGPLGGAPVTSTLELHGLRRADFVPARTLDLTVSCQAHATVTEATVQEPTCVLPAPLPEGVDGKGEVQLQAATLDLTSLHATSLRFSLQASNAWLLDWVRLLSPTIPENERPGGVTQGTLTRVPSAPTHAAFWNGQLQGTLHTTLPWNKPGESGADYPFLFQASPDGLDLEPVNLSSPAENPLSLRGAFSRSGYTLRLAGLASPAQVYALTKTMPPFGTGLSTVLPAAAASGAPAASTTQRIDLTCARTWAAPEQTCSATHAAEPPRTRAGVRRHSRR